MRSRSLGELHMAIVWLAKHENIMHRTYCPGKPGEPNPGIITRLFDALR